MPLKRRAAPRAEIMGWDGSDWQRILVESSTNPNLRVVRYDGSTKLATHAGNTDTMGGGGYGEQVSAFNAAWGGTYWERWRNNTEVTVLASATRTASGNSADQTNYNARGIILFINVTAVSGTSPTLEVRLQVKDPISGSYINYAASVQITTTGDYLTVCYPAATREYDATKIDAWDLPLPRTWRVNYAIGGTNPSFTFSVGAMYIV